MANPKFLDPGLVAARSSCTPPWLSRRLPEALQPVPFLDSTISTPWRSRYACGCNDPIASGMRFDTPSGGNLA